MPLRIGDYGLIGDTQTAALVGRDGSIDWLRLPHFESGACFAALLGDPCHGRWLLAPAEPAVAVERRYRPDTLILETTFETAHGAVRIVDFMPPRDCEPDLIRIVEGLRGEVAMRMELVVRFDYGSIVPWVRKMDGHLQALGGPDALSLWTPVETYGENLTTRANLTVRAGERQPFLLVWHGLRLVPRAVLRQLSIRLDDEVRVGRAHGEGAGGFERVRRYHVHARRPDGVDSRLVYRGPSVTAARRSGRYCRKAANRITIEWLLTRSFDREGIRRCLPCMKLITRSSATTCSSSRWSSIPTKRRSPKPAA